MKIEIEVDVKLNELLAKSGLESHKEELLNAAGKPASTL